MASKKFIIAIPARMESKRLPGKVLERIGDQTMISRVINTCCNTPNIEKTILCTDNQKIANEGDIFPVEVILKSGNFTSGTDRIFNSIDEILLKLSLPKQFSLKDIYIINIQADQPFIKKDIILNFIKHITMMDSPEILTSYYTKEYSTVQSCRDVVKLVISSKNKRVLYFSRSDIPFICSNNNKSNEELVPLTAKCHIGVYAYRLDILKTWGSLPKSKLEEYESLEQLKWLDSDIPIYAFEYPNEVISIDNKSELENVISGLGKIINQN